MKSDHSVTGRKKAGDRPNDEAVLSDHGSVKSDRSSARGRKADAEAVLSDHGSVKSQASSRASERRRKMRGIECVDPVPG